MNFFFFSSRRRHTRLQGDWSSDVCSSDLFYGEFDFVDGNFGGKNDGADESWGPKLDGRTSGCVMVAGTPFGTRNYDTSKPCHQFFGVWSWTAHSHNVRDFWKTGAQVNASGALAHR